MEIEATKVLKKMLESKSRFILSVGSSRSSKTYSVYQWIFLYCAQRRGEGKWISCIRKSFPSLKRSILREFIQFIDEMGLYSEAVHNKSSQTIELFGNYVEFFSLDNFEKVKGSKRDVAYLNEITEIDYEPAQQVFLRTTEKVIMDMNPSDTFHWVWNMKGRKDVDYIHSTYKDNPFLEDEVVKQIESYKDLDENYWRIYGLGLPGVSETTIYTRWSYYKDLPADIKDMNFGLDYGFNHPSSLIQCFEREGGELYFKEIIYERGLTVEDLVTKIEDLNLESGYLYTDSARPDLIQSLQRRGIAAKGANKKVKEGIDWLKSRKIYIHEDSVNLIKEIKHYKWKSANNIILDEPVKINDDAVDAMRYASFSNKVNDDLDIGTIFWKF